MNNGMKPRMSNLSKWSGFENQIARYSSTEATAKRNTWSEHRDGGASFKQMCYKTVVLTYFTVMGHRLYVNGE